MAYSPEDILDETEVAAVLHTSVRTLRRWRTEGRGPPYARVGKQPLYRYRGILEWLQRREEREAEEAHKRRQEWERRGVGRGDRPL